MRRHALPIRRQIDTAIVGGGSYRAYGFALPVHPRHLKAAGVPSEVATTVVDVWARLDAAMPGADITEMYPYTQKKRPAERS